MCYSCGYSSGKALKCCVGHHLDRTGDRDWGQGLGTAQVLFGCSQHQYSKRTLTQSPSKSLICLRVCVQDNLKGVSEEEHKDEDAERQVLLAEQRREEERLLLEEQQREKMEKIKAVEGELTAATEAQPFCL